MSAKSSGWITAQWFVSALVATTLWFVAPDRPAVAAQSDPDEAATPATAVPAEAAADARNTWYVATIASSTSGALVTHYWSKGSRMRAESVVAGHRIVTIVNGPYYYSLDPVAGLGIRIERSAKAREDDDDERRPFGREWAGLIAEGAERVRSETLGGQEVDVLQLTTQRGRHRVWVTQSEPRLQFRLEVFDRRSQATLTTDYSGWNSGLEISDSFFEPPSNLEIEALGYEEFRERAKQGRVGTAPTLYPELLHGRRD